GLWHCPDGLQSRSARNGSHGPGGGSARRRSHTPPPLAAHRPYGSSCGRYLEPETHHKIPGSWPDRSVQLCAAEHLVELPSYHRRASDTGNGLRTIRSCIETLRVPDGGTG